MSSRKKNSGLAVFGSYPCKGFDCLADAIPYAEKLPDGMRVVWLLNVCGSTSFMITRSVEQIARYDEAGTCTRVWQDGVKLIAESEAKPIPTDDKPPAEPATPTVKPAQAQKPIHSRPGAGKIYEAAKDLNSAAGEGMISVKSLIRKLKKAGLSADAILGILSDEGE